MTLHIMAINETVSLPIEVLGGVISLGRWLEAIGVILIAWIILNIVNFWINRSRLQAVREIQKDISSINRRLGSLERSLKKKKK